MTSSIKQNVHRIFIITDDGSLWESDSQGKSTSSTYAPEEFLQRIKTEVESRPKLDFRVELSSQIVFK